MGTYLFKDSVRYLPYRYKNEQELENFVIEHYEEVFGENTLFFEKKKLKTASGTGSIPDGFVLDLVEKKWYIVEVELARHSAYDHIGTQINKFVSWAKTGSKRRIKKRFSEEIKRDPKLDFKCKVAGITEERYEFISDMLESQPEIVVIIDENTQEVREALENLKVHPRILEFKTFVREGYGVGDHIHVLESLKDVAPVSKPKIGKKHETEQKSEGDSQEKSVKTVKIADDYSGKKPVAFSFQGKRYEVKYWRRLFFKICELMVERNPEDFHRVLDCRGKNNRPFFAKDKQIAKYSKEIKETGIFTSRVLSANAAIYRTKKLLTLFGYSPDDLANETQE